MALPALAAAVGRVALSAGAKAVVKKAVTPKAPERPGHAALSQNQFPQSPSWGS